MTYLRSTRLSRVFGDSSPFWGFLDDADTFLRDLDQSVSDALSGAEETDAAYVYTLALPGFKRDQVTVEVSDGSYLSIKASKGFLSPNAKPGGLETNGLNRHVSRAFLLPSDADSTKVEAKLEDGLLTVTVAKIAKPTPPAPRKVTVS